MSNHCEVEQGVTNQHCIRISYSHLRWACHLFAYIEDDDTNDESRRHLPHRAQDAYSASVRPAYPRVRGYLTTKLYVTDDGCPGIEHSVTSIASRQGSGAVRDGIVDGVCERNGRPLVSHSSMFFHHDEDIRCSQRSAWLFNRWICMTEVSFNNYMLCAMWILQDLLRLTFSWKMNCALQFLVSARGSEFWWFY